MMNQLSIDRFPALSYATDEAINTLCTNLTFSGENVRVIMITSSRASEGKSFLTMNIMRTMARLGKSVALVDADLRRSVITSKYGLHFAEGNSRQGLSHYLAGMAEMDDVIYQTNIDGAYMVPIGKEVSNALPLLNSARFGALIDHLAENVDYVFVDAPPVGMVIDAAQIAKSCDGMVIVVSYNNEHRQELIDVKEQMEQTGCPILGAVLNMVEHDAYFEKKYAYRSYYSYYSHKGYGYGYGQTSDSGEGKNKGKK